MRFYAVRWDAPCYGNIYQRFSELRTGIGEKNMIKIAVDAMGGDNAPGEIVKGAVDAVTERKDITV